MILYIEKPKGSTTTLLQLLKELKQDWRINHYTKNQLYFCTLSMNNSKTKLRKSNSIYNNTKKIT